MFVSKSAYDKLERLYIAALSHLGTYEREHKRVTENWNNLIDFIDMKGGEEFLEHGSIHPVSPFTQEDLNRLIRLCHPDRHDNSSASNEMTKKLLQLKEQLK